MFLTEYITDKWLTWRTGKTKAERDWVEWYDTHVCYRATTIENMFHNFEHIIEVNVEKFTDPYEPMAWVPNADAKQYFWPAKPLGENAVWRFERVSRDQWDNRWHINEMSGEDKIFVATNNSRDAMMISLKFMS